DADAMASKAEEIMLKYKIKEIVVSKENKVVGIIQFYAIGEI
ncbi:KpsF/GutQ family sugar-phosphate isomerase, partial [Campylobacter jejuni]